MWIGDTAVTCDATFRKLVMTHTETPKDSSEVVAYNDENYKPELLEALLLISVIQT